MLKKVPNYGDYTTPHKEAKSTIYGPLWEDGAGPRSFNDIFVEGTIQRVFPENFVCDVLLAKRKTLLRAVPILNQYYDSSLAQGSYAIPEIGSRCVVCRGDKEWFILGFMAKQPVDGNVNPEKNEDKRTAEAKRFIDKINPGLKIRTEDDPISVRNYGSKPYRDEGFFDGDNVRKTSAKNKSILYSTGDILHFATHLAQRVYSKTKETIFDFCRNFTLQTPNVYQSIRTDDDGKFVEEKEYKNRISDEDPTYIERKGSDINFFEKILVSSKTKAIRWFWNLDLGGKFRSGGEDQTGVQTWSCEMTNKGKFTFRNFLVGKPRSDIQLTDKSKFIMELRSQQGSSVCKKVYDPEEASYEEIYGSPFEFGRTKYKNFVYGDRSLFTFGQHSEMCASSKHETYMLGKTTSSFTTLTSMAALGYKIGIAPIEFIPNLIPTGAVNNGVPVPVTADGVDIQVTTGGISIIGTGAPTKPLGEIIFGSHINLPILPPFPFDPRLGIPSSINIPGTPFTPGIARVGDDVLVPPLFVKILQGSIVAPAGGGPCTIVPPFGEGFPVLTGFTPNGPPVYGKIAQGSTKVFAA